MSTIITLSVSILIIALLVLQSVIIEKTTSKGNQQLQQFITKKPNLSNQDRFYIYKKNRSVLKQIKILKGTSQGLLTLTVLTIVLISINANYLKFLNRYISFSALTVTEIVGLTLVTSLTINFLNNWKQLIRYLRALTNN